jgi:phosphatidylinositol alpha-1,6-mannosyltransferase
LARGLPLGKRFVIANGVNLRRFSPWPEKPRNAVGRRKTLAGTGDDSSFVLLSVGRLIPRKGFLWFIRNVVPALPANIHYWLVGEGPQHSDIERAVRQLGLTDRVNLFGLVDEASLVECYRQADLFVMPNVPLADDMEGFGLVLLEAAACATPAIAADLEGIRDAVVDGETGFLCPAGDAAAFVERICYLEQRRQVLKDLSKRAVETVTAHFAWSSIADRFVDRIHALQAEGLKKRR